MPNWQHQYSVGQSTPDPRQKRVIIRVERCFTSPIKRAQIQENAPLAKANFFKNKPNTQGTCFQVLPDTARELDALIADVERVRFKENGEPVKESIEITPRLSVPRSNNPARVVDVADGLQPGFGKDPRDAVGHPIDSGQGSPSIESAQPLTETLRAIQLHELRSRIDEGIAQAERGEGVDGDVFMQSLIDDLEVRESKHKPG